MNYTDLKVNQSYWVVDPTGIRLRKLTAKRKGTVYFSDAIGYYNYAPEKWIFSSELEAIKAFISEYEATREIAPSLVPTMNISSMDNRGGSVFGLNGTVHIPKLPDDWDRYMSWEYVDGMTVESVYKRLKALENCA